MLFFQILSNPKFFLLIAAIFLWSCVCSGQCDDVFNIDFDELNYGPISERAFRQIYPVRKVLFKDRISVVRDPERSGKVLLVKYPAESVGHNDSGGQFILKFQGSRAVSLTYWLKFGTEFDFQRGGKLPGLTSGGGRFTGGVKPFNGEGWSARLKWTARGEFVVYLYAIDVPGRWGRDLRISTSKIVRGKWYEIKQYIALNQNDQRNGVIEVWVDGYRVMRRNDIRLRLGASGLIDSLYFSTFYGGNSPDDAPLEDSYIFFDCFNVAIEGFSD